MMTDLHNIFGRLQAKNRFNVAKDLNLYPLSTEAEELTSGGGKERSPRRSLITL